MSDLLEAKPCPFCGEKSITIHEGSTFRWLVAECNGCGATSGEVRVQTMGPGLPAHWKMKAEQDVVDEWNKRAAAFAGEDRVVRDKILYWYAYGERGISSEAMACALAGLSPQQRRAAGNHPHDPDDFKRCIKFLEAVPEARQRLDIVAGLSETWAKLVEHWVELEVLFYEEFPTGAAPKLYARMKSLGC